jgi:hypothetical protein
MSAGWTETMTPRSTDTTLVIGVLSLDFVESQAVAEAIRAAVAAASRKALVMSVVRMARSSSCFQPPGPREGATMLAQRRV